MCKNPASNGGASLLMPLEGDGCFLNTAQSSDTSIGKVDMKRIENKLFTKLKNKWIRKI